MKPGGISCFLDRLFNLSENRAALHWAMRTPQSILKSRLGDELSTNFSKVFDKMKHLCQQLQSGQWLGATGKPITDVVHIGVGGSYLGPKLVTDALVDFQQKHLKVHFVGELDSHDIQATLAPLDPQTTVVIVVSKSFKTQETHQNAHTARSWFEAGLSTLVSTPDLSRHFIGVTNRADLAMDFGIAQEHVLCMDESIGGRYSVWSAVGLSVMLATSVEIFERFLVGAHEMDEHFLHADLDRNIPVLMAVIGIVYVNYLHCQTHAIIPYNSPLASLPFFLQQLEMESNGKSVTIHGEPIFHATAPVVWGQTGIAGQHAFFQMLHQGRLLTPIDFIWADDREFCDSDHRSKLVANLQAHSSVLFAGKDQQTIVNELGHRSKSTEPVNELVAHQVLAGSRPMSMLFLHDLSPESIGQLIVAYEHKVFVQSIIWQINAFDQWGVEEGKRLANSPSDEPIDDTAKLIREKFLEI